MCIRDRYQRRVHGNFEWILKNVLKTILEYVSSIENAILFSKILNDLAIQVKNFEAQIFDFSFEALQSLNLGTVSTTEKLQSITITEQQLQTNSPNTCTEILSATFIYLIGETCSYSNDIEQFYYLLSLFNQEWLFQQFKNSFKCIQMAQFKISLHFFQYIYSESQKMQENVKETYLQENIKKGFLYYFQSFSVQKQFNELFVSHIGPKILLEIFNLDFDELFQLDNTLLEQLLTEKIQNLQDLSQNFKKLNEMKELFCSKKSQIHPDAQRFIQPPQGVDLKIENKIEEKELAVIQTFMKQLDLISAEEAIQQPRKNKIQEQKVCKKEEQLSLIHI
eukprot:TRINITY_DN8716_c0_g1_i1.p1 TRINITY_DN8716_c0_g1~~TRINITY_DN8716_c0_g1_i1.p1  ORF type:complete len:336 (+),score=64.96 TRINITY_DN8716_c0_g1_i1:159-1166(+)